MSNPNKVAVFRFSDDPAAAIRSALQESGILDRIKRGDRVALKPNLTYPYHKPGVTTSPAFMREVVAALIERTQRIAIVETDGGYGAWRVAAAFEAHGINELKRRYGVEVVNLMEEPRETIRFRSRFRVHELPLPSRLLHETELLITLPVPKIHCMTKVSLAYKNQWGCVPDNMRLRRHYVFDDAIVAIDQALRPAALGDGTYFLDGNGPMEGEAVTMGLVVGASSAGAFDRYVTELMRIPWTSVRHLRAAARAGDMPRHLQEIEFNVAPGAVSQRAFRLERTARNYMALAGFKSRFITWLGYESWFGRVVLHRLLYAVYGHPIRARPEVNGPSLPI